MAKGHLLPILAYSLVVSGVLLVLGESEQISFYIKTIGKITLLVILPALFLFKIHRGIPPFLRQLPDRKSFGIALGIGLLMIIAIQVAYFFLKEAIDLALIKQQLSDNLNITDQDFLAVSTYITIGNSFIEEFFFRGFLFISFIPILGVFRSSFISAILFALYHISIFFAWFTIPIITVALLGLILGGLFFNWLDSSSKSLYPGWIAHICADISIMLIGFKMFGWI